MILKSVFFIDYYITITYAFIIIFATSLVTAITILYDLTI